MLHVKGGLFHEQTLQAYQCAKASGAMMEFFRTCMGQGPRVVIPPTVTGNTIFLTYKQWPQHEMQELHLFANVHLFGSLGRGTWYFGMHTLFVKQSWRVNQPLTHTHLRNKGNQICSMLESTSLAVPPRDDQVDYSKSSLLSLDRCIMKLTQIVNQTGDISTTFANPPGLDW